MTNEANIFYKPLRRVSFNDCHQTKQSNEKNIKSTLETMNMQHVVAMAYDEPIKANKSPRLMVCRFSDFFLTFFKEIFFNLFHCHHLSFRNGLRLNPDTLPKNRTVQLRVNVL